MHSRTSSLRLTVTTGGLNVRGAEGWSTIGERSVCPVGLSAFAGFRFPPEVIMLQARWYLRYNLSYCDLEELLGERGIDVDHGTLYR